MGYSILKEILKIIIVSKKNAHQPRLLKWFKYPIVHKNHKN